MLAEKQEAGGCTLQPRARAIMLVNYPEVARFVGLNPTVMLASVGLRASALEDPENWISGRRALELLRHSAAKARRDDFGVLLGECRSFASLGPISLLLRHEHTLRDIINGTIEYRRLINEMFHAALHVDGKSAVLEWSLVPGSSSSEGVKLLATIAYRVLVQLAGVKWQPECIHFRDSQPQNLATFRRVFGCPLEFDSSFDGMSLNTRSLESLNGFSDRELVAHAQRLLNLLPGVRHEESVTDRVRAAIPFLIAKGQARAEEVASCLGLPVRTLQRQLDREGSSFRTLLNETRRELAARYLGSSGRSVTEVAHSTGFSSVGAFTRWFTSEFRMSPSQWRRQSAAEDAVSP